MKGRGFSDGGTALGQSLKCFNFQWIYLFVISSIKEIMVLTASLALLLSIAAI